MALVPTAQYLRMSTEHQQYSLKNQAAAIQLYAQSRGFEVLRTYLDAARSGITLNRRSGLRQLLQDVVSGAADYSAILVYDVSRWGRFQDVDESAHYEFVCKSAGVPVHYCAETFANDGSLPSLIMKALKRTMAGEYSRELGVRVFQGLQRLARLGYKQGGHPGFGLRRMLVSSDGTPKQELKPGEQKSITTDRVVFVPGPKKEVDTVRQIFHMFVREKRSACYIARELNRKGIKRPDGGTWKHGTVRNLLKNPKYTGCQVFGRTSQKLYTQTVQVPREQWTIKEKAFKAIIDQPTFEAAQRRLASFRVKQSDEELLDQLRKLLARKGRLSNAIINRSRTAHSVSLYAHRFGSLAKAYELIGYDKPESFKLDRDLRRRTNAVREHLINELRTMYPGFISVLGPRPTNEKHSSTAGLPGFRPRRAREEEQDRGSEMVY